MKILMLITELGYGGAERAFLGLAGELAKRHEVEIVLYQRHYASGNYAQADQQVDAPIHLLDEVGYSGGRIARWSRRIARLRAIKKRFGPDATVSFLTGPNVLNVLTRHHDKVVISVRGTRRYDLSQSAWSRWIHAWAIDPLTMRLADIVVSVSDSLTREISGARGTDPPAKFQTVSGYVDSAALIESADATIEPELETLGRFPLVVGAGRIAPEKGGSHLLERFAAVRGSVPEAKLLLIGDGPSLPAMMELARGLGIDKDVIFAGFRPDPHRYYRLARVFVLSSMTDGFPNTLVEALATGVPILAVDAPWGAAEVLGLPADPMNRPFATCAPIDCGIGTLMPRMDQAKFARVWDVALIHHLRHDRRSKALAARQRRRLQSLDVRHAANKWEHLLAALVAHD